MIQVSNLSKTYGEQVVLRDVGFSLSQGERLGIVGRNGCGKTTLFRLILGQEHPDSGSIALPKDYRCGHLAQHLSFSQPTIIEEVCTKVALGPEQKYKAEIILAGLGFSSAQTLLPPECFSGGFQIRIELARLLLSQPNLLLLDEPTNYLDIVSVRWLERYLRSWEGEMMIISHDRSFMDSVTTHTMIIKRGGVRKIAGSSSKLYEQVSQEEEIYEKTRQNLENKKKEMSVFINRFRAKATKATLVQSKIKALERLGDMEEILEEESLYFSFCEKHFPGKTILQSDNLAFGYVNPQQKEPVQVLIDNFNLEVRKGDRIGIIGKNGKGKSTLLKLLEGELTPLKGEIKRSPNLISGYFGQTNISRLNPSLTIEEEIRNTNTNLSRTEVRNICGAMMFDGDKALKKVSVLSGGEKSRVLLGKLIAWPTNLLLLDEPNNHLDIESVDALTKSLSDYQGAVLIVTHNEDILRRLATRLVIFQNSGPIVFEGNYDYFLEKVGWEDESESQPSRCDTPTSSTSGFDSDRSNSKLNRRARALLIQERSRLLKPMEKEIQELEERIYQLEDVVKTGDQELITASQQSNGKLIAELARKVSEARSEIEVCFERLEAVSIKYDRTKLEFDERLSESARLS